MRHREKQTRNENKNGWNLMTKRTTNCDAKQRTNLYLPDPDTNRETDWMSDFESEFWFPPSLVFWCCCICGRSHLAWLWATTLCAIGCRSGRLLDVWSSNRKIARGPPADTSHWIIGTLPPTPRPSPPQRHRLTYCVLRTKAEEFCCL